MVPPDRPAPVQICRPYISFMGYANRTRSTSWVSSAIRGPDPIVILVNTMP